MEDIPREAVFSGDHEEVIEGAYSTDVSESLRGGLVRIDDRIVERDYGGFHVSEPGSKGKANGLSWAPNVYSNRFSGQRWHGG